MRAYVDANIFVLANYADDERGERAAKIIERIQSGEDTGFTCSLTIDEVMWAVHKQKQGEQLREVVEDIYQTANLHVLETPAKVPLLALEFMEEYGFRPRDAIHCAVMREHALTAIYSDDEDFDKVKWIKRKF